MSLSEVMLFAIAALFGLAFTFVTYRRSRFNGRGYFLIAGLCVSFWIIFALCEMQSSTLSTKMFWSGLSWIGAGGVSVSSLLFLFEFLFGRKVPLSLARASYILCAFLPALLGATSMYHGLLFGFGSHLDSQGATLFAVYEREGLWWAFFFLSHVVAGSSLLVLLYALVTTNALQRPVLLALFVAVMLPLFFNLAYTFFDLRVMSFNFAPFSFLFSYILLVGIVYLARAFDIEAIGADMVFYRSRHPVLVVDQQFKLYSANPALNNLAKFHGVTADTLTCNLVSHLTNQPQDGSFELADEHFLVTQIEIRAPVALGARREVVGHAYQLIDITNQKRLENKFRTLAQTDTLTQVSSRGFFMDSLDAASGVSNLGIFIIDMDFFKALNDKFGHDLGDTVLREVGATLLSISGGRQTAGRIGGEEFIVYQRLDIMPEMAGFADSICEAIRQIDISVDGTRVPLTASVGATILHKGGDVSAALRRADSALYAVKAQGRNGYKINNTSADTTSVQVGPGHNLSG